VIDALAPTSKIRHGRKCCVPRSVRAVRGAPTRSRGKGCHDVHRRDARRLCRGPMHGHEPDEQAESWAVVVLLGIPARANSSTTTSPGRPMLQDLAEDDARRLVDRSGPTGLGIADTGRRSCISPSSAMNLGCRADWMGAEPRLKTQALRPRRRVSREADSPLEEDGSNPRVPPRRRRRRWRYSASAPAYL